MKRFNCLGKDKEKNTTVTFGPKRKGANKKSTRALRRREIDLLWTNEVEEYIKSGTKPLYYGLVLNRANTETQLTCKQYLKFDVLIFS